MNHRLYATLTPNWWYHVPFVEISSTVRKRLNIDHPERQRLKPGNRIVGSEIRFLLATETDCHSSLHWPTERRLFYWSDQVGFLEVRRGGKMWLKKSWYTGHSNWFSTICSSLSHATFRRMLVRTGSHGDCVVRRMPEISRIELFSCLSTRPV